MGLIAKENGFVIPPGRHLAVCYGVVDLGTQPNNFEPEKSSRKVRLFFELSNLIMEFLDGGEKKPAGVNKEYTLSLFLSAELRNHLESWRGNKFTNEELKGFDLFKIIGKPCILEIVHKPQKKGGFWIDIKGISRAAKTDNPLQFNNTLKFSFDDYAQEKTPESFLKLPEFLQKKIVNAKEWGSLPGSLKPVLNFAQNTENDEEIF